MDAGSVQIYLCWQLHGFASTTAGCETWVVSITGYSYRTGKPERAGSPLL